MRSTTDHASGFIEAGTLFPRIPPKRVVEILRKWAEHPESYQTESVRLVVVDSVLFSDYSFTFFEFEQQTLDTFFADEDQRRQNYPNEVLPVPSGICSIPSIRRFVYLWDNKIIREDNWDLWVLEFQNYADWPADPGSIIDTTLSETEVQWVAIGMYQLGVARTLRNCFCLDSRGRPATSI